MNILITGTSRGIGFGLTAQALSQGHTVIAVSRNAEKMKSLKADYPKTLILLEADVSDEKSFQTITAEVDKLGALDLLINNAGIYKSGETLGDLAESFHVNASIPFLLTKALLPSIKKSNGRGFDVEILGAD